MRGNFRKVTRLQVHNTHDEGILETFDGHGFLEAGEDLTGFATDIDLFDVELVTIRMAFNIDDLADSEVKLTDIGNLRFFNFRCGRLLLLSSLLLFSCWLLFYLFLSLFLCLFLLYLFLLHGLFLLLGFNLFGDEENWLNKFVALLGRTDTGCDGSHGQNGSEMRVAVGQRLEQDLLSQSILEVDLAHAEVDVGEGGVLTTAEPLFAVESEVDELHFAFHGGVGSCVHLLCNVLFFTEGHLSEAGEDGHELGDDPLAPLSA